SPPRPSSGTRWSPPASTCRGSGTPRWTATPAPPAPCRKQTPAPEAQALTGRPRAVRPPGPAGDSARPQLDQADQAARRVPYRRQPAHPAVLVRLVHDRPPVHLGLGQRVVDPVDADPQQRPGLGPGHLPLGHPLADDARRAELRPPVHPEFPAEHRRVELGAPRHVVRRQLQVAHLPVHRPRAGLPPGHQAAVKISATLCPPNPNELFSTAIGLLLRGRSSRASGAIDSPPSSSGSSRLIVGGATPLRRARIAATDSIAPAPPSRCPVIDLVADTTTPLAASPGARAMASASTTSPAGVEVACAFT